MINRNGSNGSNGANGANDEEQPEDTSLLNIRLWELLAQFGAGKAVPGAGSAAATAGAVSAALVSTVAQLTLNKHAEKYVRFHSRAAFIYRRALRITQRLKAAIDKDTRVFDQVISARRARDMAVNAKDRDNLHQVALKVQKIATRLPLSIASDCLEISEFGLELYQKGFQSARGDSGVAAACSLACAQGALFVAHLNLKDFTNEKWAKDCRIQASQLLIRTKLIGIEVGEQLTASLSPDACD